jgi:hypothetical protein
MPLVPPGYADDQVFVGPANLYFNVDLPASDGSTISLDGATGYPSSGIGAGYNEAGITVGVSWSQAPEEADPAQVSLRLWSITRLSIAGRLVQARNWEYLERVLTGATKATAQLFTFGMARAPQPRLSVLATWAIWTPAPAPPPGTPFSPEPIAPGWGYAFIYSANNISDFSLGLKRDAQAGLDFNFVAEPVTSRPWADRLGQLYVG